MSSWTTFIGAVKGVEVVIHRIKMKMDLACMGVTALVME